MRGIPTNRVRSPLAEVVPLLDIMLSIWCHASNTWYGWCVVGYPISSTPIYTVYTQCMRNYLVSEDLLEVWSPIPRYQTTWYPLNTTFQKGVMTSSGLWTPNRDSDPTLERGPIWDLLWALFLEVQMVSYPLRMVSYHGSGGMHEIYTYG